MKKNILILMLFILISMFVVGCGKTENNNDEEKTSDSNNVKEEEKIDLDEEGNFVYTTSSQKMYIGKNPSDYKETYQTSKEAMDAFEKTIFLRHTVDDNKIKNIYAGFIYKNKKYYIQGGEPKSYDSQKEKIIELFGKDACLVFNYYTDCSGDDVRVLIQNDGYTEVSQNHSYCKIYNNYSFCETLK